MFTKDEMKGIMMFAQPVIQTGKDEKLKVGYYVRVSVVVRGELLFLEALERTLLQYQISCDLKEKESKSRPKPILTIKGLERLTKLCQEFVLVDGVPILSAHGKWYNFIRVLEVMSKRGHRTDVGFMEIIAIVGGIK